MGVLNNIYDNTRMHGNFRKKECVIGKPVETSVVRPTMVTKMEKIIEDDAKAEPMEKESDGVHHHH